MARDFYLLYSLDGRRLSTAVERVGRALDGRGYGYEGPIHLEPVPRRVARRIRDADPIANPLHGWLRDANPHRVGYLLANDDGERVEGVIFVVPSRHTEAERYVGRTIRSAAVRLVKRETGAPAHVPFSYDPETGLRHRPVVGRPRVRLAVVGIHGPRRACH